MAKWKLDNGEIIESFPNNLGFCHLKQDIDRIYGKVANGNKSVESYSPAQKDKKFSNFTILFKDGSTTKATLIKELDPFRRWWEDNKVDGFHLVTEHKKYWLGNHDISEGVLSSILKSWTLERQIKTLQTLIELYKE